jgi:DNA-binding response OmpR family regulator
MTARRSDDTKVGGSRADRSKGKVLLVDGDWQDSVARAEALVLGGWDVDIATSAENAFAVMDRALPDAIVTETRLDGVLDGREFARRVKSDALTRRVPVLILPDGLPGEGSALVSALEGEIAIAQLLARRRARREGSRA